MNYWIVIGFVVSFVFVTIFLGFIRLIGSELSLHRRCPAFSLTPEEKESLRQRVRESGLADGDVGLVLSGGGGKGAYQIGCWQALREFGADGFGVIAGTSVGALNAALIAQGAYEKARAVWFDISPWHVLRFNLFSSLKAFLLRIPLLPYFAFKYVTRLRGSLRPSFWEAVYFYRDDMKTHDFEILSLLRAVNKHLSNGNQGLHWWIGKLINLGFLWVFFSLVTLFSTDAPGGAYHDWQGRELPGSQWNDPSPLIKYLFIFLLQIPTLLCLFVLLWGWLLRKDQHLAKNLPLMSNQPLAELLERNFDPASFRRNAPTVFVTLATLRRVEVSRDDSPAPTNPPNIPNEPFNSMVNQPQAESKETGGAPPVEDDSKLSPNPQFRSDFMGLSGFWDDFSDFGSPEEGSKENYKVKIVAEASETKREIQVDYVPYYFELQKFTNTQIRELVLQSAALPEIFARKEISGDEYVDGGIADNTPLLPVLQTTEVKTVIVIHLSANQPADGLSLEVKKLKNRIRRAVRLDPPPVTPFRLGDDRPGQTVRVLEIVPSRGLGGFMSGTLNFFSYKSRALMRLGYDDTVRALLESDLSELKV